MITNRLYIRRPLLHAARHPQSIQSGLLLSLLKENADTEFGRRYDFASIKNLSEYQQRVPVHDYDKLEPYITRQIHGHSALTTDPPVFYARTSGTTGRYKDIPLNRHGLRQVSLAQKQLALSLWSDTGFFTGQILGFAGNADEGILPNGISYGSVSGATYQSLSRVLASKFAVPAKTHMLKSIDSKYQVFALAALGCERITGVVTANPSSMLKLVRLINEHANELLNVFYGSIPKWLSSEARNLLPDIIGKANLPRIAMLRDKLNSQRPLDPDQIFPNLSAVACWTGGSCGTAIHQLKPYLPEHVQFVEYGYGASEFMGSVNVHAKAGLCLPQLTEHVYEFVLREDWEANHPVFVGPHELIPGQDYYVFVTTRSGLYRYHINDIVRAGEYIDQSATISFLQKGKGVTNITGEKLSEHQLIEAMDNCIQTLGLNAGGYFALANEEEFRYDLYIEVMSIDHNRLAGELDHKLRALNVEYEDKRESNRLHPPRVHQLVDGATEHIKQWNIQRGVREVQYKPALLGYHRGWQPDIFSLIATEQN